MSRGWWVQRETGISLLFEDNDSELGHEFLTRLVE